MSTDLMLQIVSNSSADTEKLAERVGANLKGGEVIELISDLGGGKTTLVRGLAKGLGSTDRVSSPTFTISKVYTSSNLELHHFDFYRLEEGGMVAHELAEFINDPTCVVAIEWASIVHDVLPSDRISIHITRTKEGSRELTIRYPKSCAYALSGVKA